MTCDIEIAIALHPRHWSNISWTKVPFFGPKYSWTIHHWTKIIGVKILLDNNVLDQISLGEISFGTNYSWVKFPFFGQNRITLDKKCLGPVQYWFTKFWVKFLLDRNFLGWISFGETFHWTKFLLGKVSFFWVKYVLG